ncbi:MAG: hypothetical protein RLZZ138_497 [Actinomycetota bacterium]|jgi:hypothetical protein
MEKSVQGMLNHGFVIYNGLHFPRQVKVSLVDASKTVGARKPSINLVYEITEGRLKCISVSLTATADNKSISTAFLHSLDVDKLGREALADLALQVKANTDDELEPAELSKGRRASKELADGVARIGLRELMFIGLHYSNPLNAKSPTQAVQRNMGYGSRHTALRRIEEARSKNWVLPRGATREEIDAHFEEIRKRLEHGNGAAS